MKRCCVDGCNDAPEFQVALLLRTPTRFGESDAKIILPKYCCRAHRASVTEITEEEWGSISYGPLIDFLGAPLARDGAIGFDPLIPRPA